MCYPYGAYDEVTLRLAAEAGAALGITHPRRGLAWTLDAPFGFRGSTPTISRFEVMSVRSRGRSKL